MTEEEVWKNFCDRNGVTSDTPHMTWKFGETPDYLVALVMEKIKTATASAYELYAIDEPEGMPKVGDYSVILNARDEALCVIQTTKLTVIPYDEVGEEQAYKEGEGDRSLAYWRKIHWNFFINEYKEYGLTFKEKSKILCEEFELLYSIFSVEELTEKKAKEICTWRYEGEYAVYNFPKWEECVRLGFDIADQEKRKKEYFAVDKEGEFFGFFRVTKKEDFIELGVGIKPELCGNHNGYNMMHLVVAKARQMYLESPIQLIVRSFNKRAIKCYENVGFRVVKKYQESAHMIPGEMYLMILDKE